MTSEAKDVHEKPRSNKTRGSTAARARFMIALYVIVLAAVAALAMSEQWTPARWILLGRGTGWAACAGLIMTLAVQPLSRWRANVRPWRRTFGLWTAAMATTHAACVWFGTLADAPTSAWTWPSYRAGLIAWGLLALLALTSWGALIRRTRVRHWKVLHRGIYVASTFVAWHIVTLPWSAAWVALSVAGVIALLLLGRLVPRNARSAAESPSRPGRG